MKKKQLIFTFLALFLLILSCKDNRKKENNSTLTSVEYTIVPEKSKINWAGYKIEDGFLLSHYGTIKIAKGNLSEKKNTITGDILLDINSLTVDDVTDPEKNIEILFKLMSPDFLDTDKYPAARLQINSIVKTEATSDFNSQIEATLTLKNVTKNILILANVKQKEKNISIYTEKFRINRQQYNINHYQVTNSKEVLDDVDLQMSLIAEYK